MSNKLNLDLFLTQICFMSSEGLQLQSTNHINDFYGRFI